MRVFLSSISPSYSLTVILTKDEGFAIVTANLWIQKEQKSFARSFSRMFFGSAWYAYYDLSNLSLTLHEKCPNTEFFLDRIFPHSDWIRRDTVQIRSFFWSVFSRIRVEYGEIRSQRFAVTITNPSSFVSMTASEYDVGKEDKKNTHSKNLSLVEVVFGYWLNTISNLINLSQIFGVPVLTWCVYKLLAY